MAGDAKCRVPVLLCAMAAALAVASCGSEESSEGAGASGGGDEPLEIAYIQKQGDQQYFVDEADGAKEKARELGGVEVEVTNVSLDSNAAITAMNTAIGQEVDGIAIVVPDQKIGPQVIDMAKQAGIPLVASDDPIEDAAGKPAPFVGFDSLEMGRKVGKTAGELFRKSGWSASDTALLSVYKQDLSDCQLRHKGQLEQFEAAGGDGVKVVELGTDNSNPDAQNRTGAVVTANRDVKHWVVVGCNDESETGAVTALANAGFKAEDVIGVGLGAYLTCKDWKAGKDTGNKAALFIDGRGVGANSVEVLVKSIRDGKPLPAETIAPTDMVDAKSWEQAGVQCT